MSWKVVSKADFLLCSQMSLVRYSAVLGEKSPYSWSEFSRSSGLTVCSQSLAVMGFLLWSNLISRGALVLIENPRLPSLKCSRLTPKSRSSKSKSQFSCAILSIFA